MQTNAALLKKTGINLTGLIFFLRQLQDSGRLTFIPEKRNNSLNNLKVGWIQTNSIVRF